MRSNRFTAICVTALAACGSEGPTANDPAATVFAQEYAFSPGSVTVKVGSIVRWENSGSVAHTVTSNTGTFSSGQLAGASSTGGPYGGGISGGSVQFTFATAGTFAYHCANHPQMTATVTVVP